MAVTLKGNNGTYEGTSEDNKPLDVPVNTEFNELDTGKTYYFDGETWNEEPPCEGGGFTPTTEQLAAMNSGITAEDVAQISTNENNISSKADKKVYYITETTYTAKDNTISATIPVGLDKKIKISNNSSADGWFSVNIGNFYSTKLISAHSEEIIALAGVFSSDTVVFTNTNSRNCTFSMYADITDNVITDAEKRNTPKPVVTVDINGNGDFTNINEALTFLKNNFSVTTIPTTVYVRNGKYTFTPRTDRPMAVHKGYNKISIIGESRDGVVLEITNTSTAQNKLLDVAGECTIANMTINVLNDGTYTSSTDLGYNPYCIHIDEGTTDTVAQQYYTTIANCKLYSECASPIGAGLRDKQVQRFVNCECISNNQHDTTVGGALSVHASVEANATDMGVEIDNCTCISKSNTMAIALSNVAPSYGSLTYADIDTTIKRTICVTNGNTITDVSQSTHRMTEDCALNNVSALNYV